MFWARGRVWHRQKANRELEEHSLPIESLCHYNRALGVRKTTTCLAGEASFQPSPRIAWCVLPEPAEGNRELHVTSDGFRRV